MSDNPTITITRNQRAVTITRSPIGLQGVPGLGFPIGGTEGQVLAKESDTDYDTTWTSLLVGATRIEIVDSVPDPQVAGVLYLSKS